MERIFDGMLHIYTPSRLRWVLGHRPVMLAMFLAVLGATGYFYMVVPKGFIPDTDNDNFNVNTEAAQGTSYYQMVKYQERVSQIVVQDPDIESFYSSTGGGFGGASGSTGRMMVNLRPRRQREATVNDIVNRLRPKVSNIPGLAGLPLDSRRRSAWAGACRRAATITRLYGPDTDELYAEAPKLERIVARLPGLLEVSSDLQIKTPRVNIVLDRDRAAALNLNWNQYLQHALRRLRPAGSPPPSTHRPTSTACCSKCCPPTSSTPTGWT